MSTPRLPAAALLLLAAGCATVGPDYEPPGAEVPVSWREGAGEGTAAGPADLAAWWRRFGDPVLDHLVDRAIGQGLDVREALERVREARALRGGAAADRYPTLDGVIAYRRSGESDETAAGAFAGDSDFFSAGLDASWEVDLWGRVRRSVEAADAGLDASVEDARAALVTVVAETALRYVELRAFRRRLAVSRGSVALQEQSLALARARFETGLSGERDVSQARTGVETTRARIPALEAGARAAENRLAVLLGRPPGDLAEALAADRPVPAPPAEVPVGVPADLLRRRADVRRAERLLAVETARIGVAEADLYPRLVLHGRIGVEAEQAPGLLDAGSDAFSVGPSIRWNLFDGGRARSRIAAQDARAAQALVRWERAVLTALEEAENAMTAYSRERERRRLLSEAYGEAARAAELSRTQYAEGLSDFQVVLDSERVLSVLADDLAVSEAAVAANLVALYKALGGGWESALPGAAAAPAPAPAD